MFLSFKQRKYSTAQKWHVSRGFLENPYRPVLTDLAEPTPAVESLHSRIEASIEPSPEDLNKHQTGTFRNLAGALQSSHELMGKGRVK